MSKIGGSFCGEPKQTRSETLPPSTCYLSLYGKRGGGDKVNVQFAFIVHFGRADICGPILFGNLEAIMPDYVPQHFLLFTISCTLTLPLFAALKRGKKNNNNMVRTRRESAESG